MDFRQRVLAEKKYPAMRFLEKFFENIPDSLYLQQTFRIKNSKLSP